MKQLLANLLGICLLTAASLPIAYSQTAKRPGADVLQQQQSGPLVEEFSFVLTDFRMDHQGEANKLDISVSYRYAVNIANADYPDFRWLAKDVETLLNNYPNKDDYWEIVNKNVTALLMKKYPAITSVTCEFKVEPSRNVPYSRTSRVTRSRAQVKSKRA